MGKFLQSKKIKEKIEKLRKQLKELNKNKVKPIKLPQHIISAKLKTKKKYNLLLLPVRN